MSSLRKFLSDKGYCRIPLTRTKTNHFEITAVINGVEGRFIIDTGASASCIGMDCIDHFKLTTETSEIKAAGAGSSEMSTMLSRKNTLAIGKWEKKKIKLLLFDLSHVNTALTNHHAEPVHGIIGADVFKRGKAIIDYDRKTLYLK